MKVFIQEWEKYNLLTVIKEIDKKWKRRFVRCKCKCWNIKDVWLSNLRWWQVKSCWCLQIVNTKKSNITHWMKWTRIYKCFMWIKDRLNTKSKDYNDYWWRWIKCEWKNFKEFYKDMKEWYSDNLTIDRIDNDWNYCKENCRWITMKKQSRNKRNNIVYNLEIARDASIRLWWCKDLVTQRIRQWWSIKDAFTKKIKK